MNGHARVVVSFVLACAAGAIVNGQQRPAHEPATIRLDILVTDGGRAVRGLTPGNFEVRDSGVVQAVSRVDAPPLPLDLILALDPRVFVGANRLAPFVDAVEAAIDTLGAGDRVTVLPFSGRVHLLRPPQSVRGQVREALTSSRGNVMSLCDGAFSGMTVAGSGGGRAVMLLVSDGIDHFSWLREDAVIEAARRASVVIYPVRIRLAYKRPIVDPPPKVSRTPSPGQPIGSYEGMAMDRTTVVEREIKAPFLDALADATGGRTVVVRDHLDLRDSFVATLAELRDRYVLTYEPQGVPAGGWHPIQVKLKGTQGTVTTRRGYFAQ